MEMGWRGADTCSERHPSHLNGMISGQPKGDGMTGCAPESVMSTDEFVSCASFSRGNEARDSFRSGRDPGLWDILISRGSMRVKVVGPEGGGSQGATTVLDVENKA